MSALVSRASAISLAAVVAAAFTVPAIAFCQELIDEISWGDFARVEEILERDPGQLNQTRLGFTPLHFAAYYGHADIAELLLAHGADINARGGNQTPLSRAVVRRHFQVASLLIEKGAEITDYEIGACGLSRLVRQKVTRGENLEREDHLGRTLLHGAAYGGHREIAELLVEGGVDVSAATAYGETPLDVAVAYDHEEIARLLRSRGAVETPVPEPERVMLSANIYRLTFPYRGRSNIGVFTGPGGVVLIDSGFRRTANKLAEELRRLGGGEARYVVNTHPHSDHDGGNARFASATIVDLSHLDSLTSVGVLSRVEAPQPDDSAGERENIYSLRFGDEEIQLIPVPGTHSAFDLIVYFKRSRIGFAGDVLFASDFPRDQESRADYLNRIERTMRSKGERHLNLLDRMTSLLPSNAILVAGHGPEYSMADVIEYLTTARGLLDTPNP